MPVSQDKGRSARPGATPWLLALALATSGCADHRVGEETPPLSRGDLAASLAGRSLASSGSAQAACTQGTDPWILPLGIAATPGAPMKLLVVSERPLVGVRLEDEGGQALRGTTVLDHGPPYALLFEGPAPLRTARYRLRASARTPAGAPAAVLACAQVAVASSEASTAREEPAPRVAPRSGIWAIRTGWDEGWERAFSAWVAWLFRPLGGKALAWRPIQQVLRDPARNFLYDVLGLGEDSGRSIGRGAGTGSGSGAGRTSRVIAWADCGDTPYQLRAYFAWKHGLPFRYRRCDRGTGVRGPRCPLSRDNRYGAFDHLRDPVERFNAFLREGLAWQVHSGTTRTLPEDEASDFYPIRLSRETIRPGTIFVDVGGHVFVVTQWDAEGLFAVDGHPDFSVTRRRFSQTHFRYFRGTRTGGFKAFRPLRFVGGALVPLPNQAVSPSYSVEQYRFGTGRDFHQAMARMLAAHHPG